MCFRKKGEPSEVKPYIYHYCNILKINFHIIIDQIQKVIDEYNKLVQEKKNWEAQLK